MDPIVRIVKVLVPTDHVDRQAALVLIAQEDGPQLIGDAEPELGIDLGEIVFQDLSRGLPRRVARVVGVLGKKALVHQALKPWVAAGCRKFLATHVQVKGIVRLIRIVAEIAGQDRT